MSFDTPVFFTGLSRRDWLRVSGATGLFGTLMLAGCKGPPPTGGTFLQAWNDQINWTSERWRSVLSGMYELGCESIFLQWVGLEGETMPQWDARGRMLQLLLDESQSVGMNVHIGLLYNQNWWDAIDQTDDGMVAGYLQNIGQNCINYMRSVTWSQHPAFAGWYIPYELEQYHWGQSPQRLAMLASWLKSLADVVVETSGREPTVSTYYSEMASPESLAQMWSYLLDRVVIRPMIQDGVGVQGIDNYAKLEPLHQMLLRRGAYFDLVVELFERKPDAANLVGQFQAQTASVDRLRAQWNVAQNYNARRIVAFALEPWASQDTPEGRQLRSVWKFDPRVQQALKNRS